MIYYENDCQTIYGHHYCKKKEITENKQTCIPALINQQPAICNYTIQKPKNHVTRINEASIFVSPADEYIEFESDCPRTTNKIKESTILEFSDCYINILNQRFQNTGNQTYTIQIERIPWNDVTINNEIPEANIHYIQNWTMENIEELHQKHQRTTLHHYAQYSITSIIIIILIILFIFHKFNIQLPLRFRRNRIANLRGEELRDTSLSNSTRNIHNKDIPLITYKEEHDAKQQSSFT